MFSFFTLLFLISCLAICVFAIIAIIKFVQKNSATGKKMLIFTGASFALFIVSLIVMIVTVPDTVEGEKTPVTKVVAKETAAEKVDREAKETEEKEAKEKTAAEEKAKEEKEAKEKIAKEKAEAEKVAKEKVKADAKAKKVAAERAKKEAEEKEKAEARKIAKAEKEAKNKAVAKKKAKAAREQTAKTNAKKITFPMLNKAADRYAGKPYYLKGEVVQAMENGNFTAMRINVTQNSWGWTDTVWVEFDDVTDAVDGDIVEVYGKIFGKYTYDTAIGGKMTLPGIIAERVKVIK